MAEAPTIWHNPRCSKSRQTLALLRENGVEPQILRYLDDPPTAETLDHVLELLDMSPRDLIRRREAPYKELGLKDENKTRQELIDAMVANPKLIERPVVIAGGRAALGRPPESVLDLFN